MTFLARPASFLRSHWPWESKMDRALRLLTTLTDEMKTMSQIQDQINAQLVQLKTDLTAQTNATQAATTAMQTMASQMKAQTDALAAANPTVDLSGFADLHSAWSANIQALGSAVTANTTSAPSPAVSSTPPTPNQAPPVTTPSTAPAASTDATAVTTPDPTSQS